ncbi:hypothetical protein [Nostoc sp. MS1]|uniref:hypothetical protein n=1 Tax=Nostoc sp. MS1 TaxID=2764711 RepID=UPI001CC5FB52|nr:hypothetical protein [Nostoc sp. MS1]
MNSIYSFELYVVLVQSEVFRDRLAKLSFKSHYPTLTLPLQRRGNFSNFDCSYVRSPILRIALFLVCQRSPRQITKSAITVIDF